MLTIKHKLIATPFPFRQSAGLLQSMMENAAVGMALVGAEGRLIYANDAYARMFGYEAEECVGLGPADLVHPEEQWSAGDQLGQLTRGEINSYRAERRFRRKDGSFFWGRLTASLLRDEQTRNPLYFVLQIEDINQQKVAEAALAESESRWNFALEGAGQGVWDHDLRHGKVFFSRTWRQMRGIGLDEEVDGSRGAWLSRVHPDDRERIIDQADRQNSGELPQNSFEYRERHRDGHYLWILSRGKPVEWMPDGSVARIIGTDTDISGLKLAEARALEETAKTYRRHLAALQKAHEATEAAHQLADTLARHDALTGLPNRRVFSEALEAASKRGARGISPYAILIIDLDRFKPVNDIHGHHVGDDVLREIATRIGNVVRKGDTFARLGGDEFGIILDCLLSEEVEPTASATRLADRIIKSVREPISIGNSRVDVGASIGIAVSPTDGTDSETLLRAADMAMYRAKGGGSGTYCFFQQSMEQELRTRLALEGDFRAAVSKELIRPFYQPLVRLAENRLVGFEILARWRHPTRGNVEPEIFIPIAETLGLIGELTYSLLRRACLDARDWPQEITIALNISPKHLVDPVLPVKLLAILAETDFPPKRLEIEITETALVRDLDAARTVLVALQNIGIKISLDDFGTGYSSLYHLRELRFDKIKIDRSFVLSMETNAESAKIVQSVIDLASSLGLPTIAEGIEHSRVMQQIMLSGGEYGQGFYFGKAMSAADATLLVNRAEADVLRRA